MNKTTFYCEATGKEPARLAQIAIILADHDVSGASIFHGVGLWEGDLENTFKLEVISETTVEKARAIAADLASAFEQDTVLYTVELLEAFELVKGDGTTYEND
jgi:hypothetical protein